MAESDGKLGSWAKSATAAAALAVVVALTATPARAAGAQEVLAASALVERIAAGQLVDLRDVTIDGDVDLRRVGTVVRPIRCDRCRLMGALDASRVVFERSLELVESSIAGALVLEGAAFDDRFSLEQSPVAGPVRLRAATFGAAASFAGARFAATDFRETRFDGRVSFDGARFGAEASFDGAGFAGRPSFIRAVFAAPARFRAVELPAGASFDVARFDDGLAFDRATAGGVLALDGAHIVGDAAFTHFRTDGTLSLEDIEIDGGRLFLDQTTVHDLSLPFAKIDKLPNTEIQKSVLRLLRRSAEARDDLGQANQATYRLRTLEGREKHGWLARAWDTVDRRVAGYLVLPLNPLVSLLGVMAVATAARTGRSGWRALRGRPGFRRRVEAARRLRNRFPHVHARLLAATVPSDTPPRAGVATSVARLVGAVVASAARTFKEAWTWNPSIVVAAPDRLGSYLWAGALLTEWLTYKFLAAVFLIALGNANPTVRQLIDAVAR